MVALTFNLKVLPTTTLTLWAIILSLCKVGCLLNSTISPSTKCLSTISPFSKTILLVSTYFNAIWLFEFFLIVFIPGYLFGPFNKYE